MLHDPSQIYQPEADTYLLLEEALKEVRTGDRVLEVGTGSGLVARELAKVAGMVIATDINPNAVACAAESGVEVIRTDLVSGIQGQFNLIVFNPPYLPTRPEERIDDWLEYALDGGESGRSVIERFASDAGRVLAPGGRILLLISSLTGLQEVTELFRQYGFAVGIAAQRAVEGEVLSVLRIVRQGNP